MRTGRLNGRRSMFISDLVVAFVVAFVLTVVFARMFRRHGPWESEFWFFVALFLATWAGGVWIRPFGPIIAGAYWLPFILMGILFALLLAAVTPRRQESAPRKSQESRDTEDAKVAALERTIAIGWLFWVFMLLLVTAVLLRYLLVAAVD